MGGDERRRLERRLSGNSERAVPRARNRQGVRDWRRWWVLDT